MGAVFWVDLVRKRRKISPMEKRARGCFIPFSFPTRPLRYVGSKLGTGLSPVDKCSLDFCMGQLLDHLVI